MTTPLRHLANPLVLRFVLAGLLAATVAAAGVVASPPPPVAARAHANVVPLASTASPGAPSFLGASGASSIDGRPISPCGGEGERACTVIERSVERALFGCDDGLAEIPGCTGDCFGGEVFGVEVNSSGMCIRPTPCGGKGQRACNLYEQTTRLRPSCDPGLTEVVGCTGDCWGFGVPIGLPSLGMCTVIEDIPEPDTNVDVEPAACSLKGYVDMHMHLFADQANGGGVLAGKPYHPTGGINAALRQDFNTDDDLVAGDGSEWGPGGDKPCVPQPGLHDCTKDLFHGLHDPVVGEPIGSPFGTQDGAGSNFGAPLFNGWPKWTSTTHQQVYYKWLERAWQGGLRLITQLAVTNEALCRGSKHIKGVNCFNSMDSIDLQINEAYEFEKFIDNQSGGPGKGWFRIVKTPLEAREAIALGKLAVVLGIETAEMFNCYERGACTESFVEDEVERYYRLGVRHVFPIHNFDNAFGAAATWQDGIEVGQRLVEQRWWEPEQCPTVASGSFGFKLGGLTQLFITLLKFTKFIDPLSHPSGSETASCNSRGMTPLGEVLMNKLMEKGMIIDVDHMAIKAFDRALQMAESHTPNRYPGIAASHVLSFDRHVQERRHERLRTSAQLQRIRNVGGMIAAMLKDDAQDTDKKGKKFTIPYGDVPDDCRYSSKTFANAYQYAVDQMGGPVALGSDFNGVAGHIGPRFGSEACSGATIPGLSPDPDGVIAERNAQLRENKKVEYPFVLPGFGTFDKQVTGHRTFDYNIDGMAHVGLLPDFIEDLKVVGMPQYYIDQMFNSAEAYIKMWEGAAAASPSNNDDTPALAVSDTCTYIFEPGITVTDAPAEVDEGQKASFSFTVRQSWNVQASCAPAARVHTESVARTGSSDPTLDEYKVTCAWKGGDWSGPQEGTVTLTASKLRTTKSEAVKVPVINRAPVIDGLVDANATTGVVFSEQISLLDAPAEKLTGSLNFGDGSPAQVFGATVPFAGSVSLLGLHTYLQPGTYTIVLKVKDELVEVSRTATVVVTGEPDREPPVLTVPGNIVVEATSAAGAEVTFTATWKDNLLEGGPFAAGCGIPLADLSIPGDNVRANGVAYIYPLGVTMIHCSAIDRSGNTAFGIFTITVVDTTPPVITVTPPLAALAELGQTTAVVPYKATATDLVDGPVTPVCKKASGQSVSPSGDSFPRGLTAIECTATDARTNKSVRGFSVRVDTGRDGIPFTLIVPEFGSPAHSWRFEERRGGNSPPPSRVLDTGMSTMRVDGALGPGVVHEFRGFCSPEGQRAMMFPGNPDAIVDFGHDATQFGFDDFTISLWVNTNRSEGTLLSRRSRFLTSTVYFELRLEAGDLVFELGKIPLDPDGSAAPAPNRAVFRNLANEEIRVNDGNWHHVALQRKNEVVPGLGIQSTEASLRVDGRLDPLVGTTLMPLIFMSSDATDPTKLVFWAGITPPVSPIDDSSLRSAQLDEIQIFDRAVDVADLELMAKKHPNDVAPNDSRCDLPLTDLLVEATSPSGAIVNYTATVFDYEGERPADCRRDEQGDGFPSGSQLPVGTHHIFCTTIDVDGDSLTLPFTIEVLQDNAPPTISPHADIVKEATGPNGAAVAYTAPATSDFQDGPGVATCSPASNATFPLGHTKVTCQATDTSGNKAADTFFDVHVRDTTPPTIAHHADVFAEATGPNGATVVYTSPATQDIVDPPGVATCGQASNTLFALGLKKVICQATDKAGNTAVDTFFHVIVQDTMPPQITVAVSPDANPAGWHKDPARIEWTVTDIVGVTQSIGCDLTTITQETSGATLMCVATDAALNTAVERVTIRLDRTGPAIAFESALPPANGNAWHRTDVSMAFTITDGRSGLPAGAPTGGSLTFSTEGAGLTQTVTATDIADNTTVATSPPINLDKTAPRIAGQRTPDANAHGWNNVDVTASFDCEDDLSRIDTCTPAETLTTEAAGQSRNGVARDKAGNEASATVADINIDRTAPTIRSARDRAPNANNWYKADVTVSFTCADTLSGIRSCSPPQTIASEGANLSSAGVARDLADNEAATIETGINLDKTAPTVAGAPDRAPNANNWYNVDVTVSFSCADTLSGVGTCGPTPQIVSEEGMNLSRSASVMDLAGNAAAATVGGINLDKTAPVVNCSHSGPGLWPPNHKLVPIQATVSVQDGLSKTSGFMLVRVTSNEPDNGLGDGDTPNDIQGFDFGTPDTSGLLRAERAGPLAPRIYSLFYQGGDLAGNVTACMTLVTVAHDQSSKK